MKLKSVFVNSIILLAIASVIGCSKSSSSSSNGCNSVVSKLKKYYSVNTSTPFDTLSVTYNSNGTVNQVFNHLQGNLPQGFSFRYANGKISQAILTSLSTNTITDTVDYFYNSSNLLDSLSLRKTTNSYANVKFVYSGSTLVKVKGYSRAIPTFYWDIVADANGNITRAEQYWTSSTGWQKESLYEFTRDDRKNPFNPFAIYLLGSGYDEAYHYFRLMGSNNYTNQTYTDYTGSGLVLTTGFQYKLNSDCYPTASTATIDGQVLFAGDDFRFSYY